MESNYWKEATIVLIFLCLIFSIIIIGQNKYMDIGGVKIKESNFYNLNSAMIEDQPYMLCSIPQNKCVKMIKQNLN